MVEEGVEAGAVVERVVEVVEEGLGAEVVERVVLVVVERVVVVVVERVVVVIACTQ